MLWFGWRGRIRTFDLLIQSQAPYRLATRQWGGGHRTASTCPPAKPAVRPPSATLPPVDHQPPDPDAPVSGDLAEPGESSLPGVDHAPRPHRSRYLPAFLDALIPGLGHLVVGRWRRALLFVSPLLIGLATAGWIVATTSTARIAASLLSNEVILGLLAAQGLLLASRLMAVGSSLLDPVLPRPGRRDLLPIALLVVFVIAPQAYAGYATEVAREAADQIFVEPVTAVVPHGTAAPDPSFLSTAPPSLPSASPSAESSSQRITALVLGVDSGVGRNTYLTDTMIVVSLDRATRTVSMLSIPRDMVDVPMPDGRQYRDKINSLVAYARHHPAQFPGSDGTGFDVLMGALATLTGIPIDYYAKVDLGGFVRVVDVLGGVDVNVAHGFCDPGYQEYGFANGFSITAGRHHLNGQQALAYARVRHPAGESDFTRAARQQEVVSAIRDSIVHGGFLNDPIGLLQAVSKTVETNVPRDLLPDLADLATQVGREQTFRAVVTHPLVGSGFDVRGSIQIPDVPGIRKLAAELFPTDGSMPSATYGLPAPSTTAVAGSGVGGCRPAPKPKPTPTPTPKPSTTPSGGPTAGPSDSAPPPGSSEPSAVPAESPAP
jgi:LCP family protein required for cell wall assembly